MRLKQDIELNSEAFKTASAEMSALKTRAENLKAKLEQMYKDLTTALDTPAGKAIQIEAKEVLIEPIDDLIAIIGQMSKTLSDIIARPYYQNVFDNYEKLVQNLNL